MRIWNAPVGYEADLGEMPGLRRGTAAAGLDAVGQVVDLVVRYLTNDADASDANAGHDGASDTDGTGGDPGEPIPARPQDPRSYLESLSWHSLPLTDAPLRLGLRVVDRSGASVVLRLHGVDPAGEVRIAADLRCRRTGAATPTPARVAADLLTLPVGAGDSIRRSYPIEAHMLTHHIPDAPGVLMTPNLIALMEETAADIVRPRLVKGAAAVGTWIGVRHTDAALLDQRLDIDAVVVRTGGRRITFDVNAYVGTRRIGDGQVGFTLIPAAT